MKIVEYAGLGALLVGGFLVYKSYSAVKTIVAPPAAKPTKNDAPADNPISRWFNASSGVRKDDGQAISIGTKIYDWTHPSGNAIAPLVTKK